MLSRKKLEWTNLSRDFMIYRYTQFFRLTDFDYQRGNNSEIWWYIGSWFFWKCWDLQVHHWEDPAKDDPTERFRQVPHCGAALWTQPPSHLCQETRGWKTIKTTGYITRNWDLSYLTIKTFWMINWPRIHEKSGHTWYLCPLWSVQKNNTSKQREIEN